MNKTISASKARQQFFKLIEETDQRGEFVVITVEGSPKVVMMSAEEFESWQETLEITKDFPDLKKDIKEVEKDLKNKNYKKYTSFYKILAKEGYILADSKHGLSNNFQTKRGKKSAKTERKRS